MFRHGRVRSLLAAGALIVAPACSQSPTSPSPASSSPASSSAAEAADPNAAAGTQDIMFLVGNAIGATRFLAFGDSLTEGVESRFDEAIADLVMVAATPVSYPTQLGPFLNGRFPAQSGQFSIVNAGVGAETAATGAQRLPGVLSSTRPQVLLLLEGINDIGGGGRGIGETVGHLRTMVETARLFNVTVLIGNMFQTVRFEPPDGPVRDNAHTLIPAFNEAIRQMVQGRQNVFLVDLYHAFGDNPTFLGTDGLHPTPAGYARMAEWFGATLAQAFPVRGAFQ